MQNHKANDEAEKETRTPNPFPLKRLFSISEAAFYLSKGQFSVREMIWNRTLPIVRDGRRILLDKCDLDLWVEKNKSQYVMRIQDERVNNGKKKINHPD